MGMAAAGLALLAVSVTAAFVNEWAGDAFPTQWGGPNIGAGMLQLIFYAGAATGAVMVVLGLVKRQRTRSS